MNDIIIDSTENSPEVNLDFSSGLIDINGESYPEDTFGFYEPIIKWLEEYFGGVAKDGTIVNIKLTYFNSASTQILFDIMEILNDGECENLTVNWFYDSSDEDGMVDYEDYADEYPDLNINAVAF